MQTIYKLILTIAFMVAGAAHATETMDVAAPNESTTAEQSLPVQYDLEFAIAFELFSTDRTIE